MLGSHVKPIYGAMAVSVLGWALMWAWGLAIIDFPPWWFSMILFLAGLAAIPFCRRGARKNTP